RKLALLEAEQVQHLKPACADLQRPAHVHAVRLRGIAHTYAQVAESVVQRLAGRSGRTQVPQLGDRVAGGPEGAGSVGLVAREDMRPAKVRPREQPLEAPLELPEHATLTLRRRAQRVDLAQGLLRVALLP